MRDPRRVDVGPDACVFVGGRLGIQKFSPDGRLLVSFGGKGQPGQVGNYVFLAAGPNGMVYVAESPPGGQGGTVKVFGPAGN
jgi:hypothetical protein